MHKICGRSRRRWIASIPKLDVESFKPQLANEVRELVEALEDPFTATLPAQSSRFGTHLNLEQPAAACA